MVKMRTNTLPTMTTMVIMVVIEVVVGVEAEDVEEVAGEDVEVDLYHRVVINHMQTHQQTFTLKQTFQLWHQRQRVRTKMDQQWRVVPQLETARWIRIR